VQLAQKMRVKPCRTVVVDSVGIFVENKLSTGAKSGENALKQTYTRSYPHYPQEYTMIVVRFFTLSSSKVCFVIYVKLVQNYRKLKCLT